MAVCIYEHTDVPAGMTLAEYRRARRRTEDEVRRASAPRRLARRMRRRPARAR